MPNCDPWDRFFLSVPHTHVRFLYSGLDIICVRRDPVFPVLDIFSGKLSPGIVFQKIFQPPPPHKDQLVAP